MKRYTDQVQINVRVINDVDRTESFEEWFVTAQGVGEVDRAAITADVLAELRPSDYTLDEHHRSVNWGASSALFDLIIGISGGAIGGALAPGLGAQMERIADRFRRDDADDDLLMTDASVTREARNILCRRYVVDHGDLTPMSTTVDVENRRASIVLSGPDGVVYTVEIKRVRGRVSITKVTRAESTSS